jgi:pimeloyl-ACP methyl ester carboxylesterase
MNHWLIALAALTAIALYVLLLHLWLSPRPSWNERLTATTRDGWPLSLYYYAPSGPSRGAVICVPGIYANAATFDVDPAHSLALHLASQGFATYCLELRSLTRGSRARRFGRFRHAARYHDYLSLDLPAALEAVCAHSRRERVHYIGHSMGGMLFYPLGSQTARIDRAVTIGSMGQLGRMVGWRRWLHGPLRLLERAQLVRFFPHVYAREASAYLLAPLVGVEPLITQRFVAPAHRESAADRRYFFSAVANTPTTLIFDFARMIRAGVMGDEANDYEAMTRDNHIPTLVIAGTADRIAPERLVRAGFDLLGGKKEYLRCEGFGHCDMVYSRAAHRDIWPAIVTWLGDGLNKLNKPGFV